MTKIAKIEFNGMETYFEGLLLPDVGFLFIEEIDVSEFTSNISGSIYRIVGLDMKSIFHLFGYIMLRNEFDLFSGIPYYGEVRLGYIDLVDGMVKIITAARCRISSIEISEGASVS